MEIKLLRSFVVLAEELHFGRAAARIHVVQAALSQQIRALEDEVGARLFERTTRRVQLTEVGRVFLPDAREVLAVAERAAQRVQRAARGLVGELRVAFVAAAALAPLPAALEASREQLEEVQLQLSELGTEAQLAALRAEEIDVGFVLAPVDAGALATREVSREPLHVVVPAEHRLAGRKRVSLRDLEGEPIVWMNARSEPQLRRHFVELCNAQGVEPDIAYEVDHVATMLGLVAAGLGVSFTPLSTMRLRSDGVRLIRLSPRVTAAIHMVWSPDNPSPVLERFLSSTSELARGEKLTPRVRAASECAIR